MSKTSNLVKKIVILALLSAIGTIFMLLEIPFTQDLMIDISDTTTIIGGLLYGPLGIVVVALIKSFVHFLHYAKYGGVGQLIAFVASLSYTFPFLFTFKFIRKLTKNDYLIRIIPGIIGTGFLTVIMYFFNILVSFPLVNLQIEDKLTYSEIKVLAAAYTPGNLLKGAILTIIFFILSFRLEQVYKIMGIKESTNILIDKD